MRRRRLPLAPEEGWIAVGLVGVMAVTAAWSIDEAGWVLGRTEWTDFLAWAAFGGVVAGFIGSKVGWNRWLAHLIGALFAALIVPVLVGDVLPNGGTTPGSQFVATAAAAARAWSDLIIKGQPATQQIGHHLLVLGLLCWGTGQFAAAAVFRHRRPLSAVVVIGAIMIGNMSATLDDQLGYLILFSLAALFLLIRLHALDEQATWVRRRIGDPTAVGSIYLRGGTVFIVAAVLGALALTATARSAPLAGAWEELKPWLLDVSAAIQRFLPAGIDSRGIGSIQFGPTALIQNQWTTNGDLAFTIQRPLGDVRPYYWRVTAYDRFNNYGWEWSDSAANPRPAGEPILAGSLEEPPIEGTKEVTFTVTPDSYYGPYAVSPISPLAIDRDSQFLGLGDDQLFEAIQIAGRSSYDITARVQILGDADNGVTENRLRVAGTTYPEEISARYLGVPDGAVGPEARQVLNDVLAKVQNDNPYDVARQMVAELQGSRFNYTTNVSGVDCGDRTKTECFAFSRRGFCQHYASLMTILLREHKIPARYVMGFLPGGLARVTGVEQITNQNSHAWVEVYFPGFGWYPFDPTGGNVSQAERLPAGRPVASASPTPFRSRSPDDAEGPDNPRRSPGEGAGSIGGPRGPGAGPFIVIAILLLVSVAAIAYLAWRRGPRGPTTPEGAYAGVARLAARFGFGPRPTQTAYEYAAALGDVLPNIRPELHTVASAKVEVAYGRRTLSDERIRALRESYRRLRVALLRLFFLRRSRRPRA